MSLFVILGDCHIGARNASTIVAEHQIQFFENQLFPYMERNNLSTILQLGDLFDTRKYTNHGILNMWKERVFDVIENKNYSLITLLGNHDAFTRNSLKVNSTSLFLSNYSNITIITEPTEYCFYGLDFMLVPWICMDNESNVKIQVNKTDALFCAGHFEFNGFEMQKGVSAHGGYSLELYDKFDQVFSGHYHTRSEKKNVLYTGVPYEMTWADFNDQKGFHVFNTKTHKTTFIKTKQTLFKRIEYNDKVDIPTAPLDVAGSYVKVVVINKTNPYEFEKFINSISMQNPADLRITEIDTDFEDVDIDEELELEDTKTLIAKFVEQVDTDLDTSRLKDMMQSLYLKALEITE